ncbi:MAG TPA: AMP-binding protein, partial [Candidatus Omnitrophota bacterium]|nr:AMP-binding protein [Candidatus Omnitrophota bacterium]
MTDAVRTLIDALAAGDNPHSPITIHGPRGAEIQATTWGDLDGESTVLARRLLSAGFAAGDRIGLVADTDLSFLLLFVALQKAGLVPVPLPLPNAFGDRAAHAERIERMLAAAG